MRRRTALALLGGFGATGCLGSDGNTGTTTGSVAGTGTGEPGQLALSGSGAERTDAFALEAGLAVATFDHHPAGGGFNAQLVDVAHPNDTILLNVLGEDAGRTAFGLDGGEYRLEVDGTGEWTVGIDQPRSDEVAATAEPLPTVQDGDGSDVRGPFELDGTVDVTATYDGQDEFGVEVLDERGASVAPNLFDRIGSFDGTATFDHRGYGWFDVTTTGTWSIDVEPG